MLKAIATIQTDKGDYVFHDITIPVGSKVGDFPETFFSETVYDELVKYTPSFAYDLESTTATMTLKSDINPEISVDFDLDHVMTKDEVIVAIQDGSFIRDGFEAFVDYLQQFPIKLEILKSNLTFSVKITNTTKISKEGNVITGTIESINGSDALYIQDGQDFIVNISGMALLGTYMQYGRVVHRFFVGDKFFCTINVEKDLSESESMMITILTERHEAMKLLYESV